MIKNHLATEERCAVNLASLKLPISDEDALNILKKIGFEVKNIDLIEMARSCIGQSIYRRGALICRAPMEVDCSSFTKWLYAQKGIKLPRRSIQQRAMGEEVSLSDGLPGDLIFVSGYSDYFWDDPKDGVGHVGIFTESDTVIHAANRKVGVIETPATDFIGSVEKFRGVRRIVNGNVITLTTPPIRNVEFSDDIRWIILQNL